MTDKQKLSQTDIIDNINNISDEDCDAYVKYCEQEELNKDFERHCDQQELINELIDNLKAMVTHCCCNYGGIDETGISAQPCDICDKARGLINKAKKTIIKRENPSG